MSLSLHLWKKILKKNSPYLLSVCVQNMLFNSSIEVGWLGFMAYQTL